jgi:hypothetical protein
MKNFTRCLLLSAIVFSSFAVKAQHRDTVKTDGWIKHDIAGAAQIQVEYRKYDVGGLNNALNANGLPSISNNNIWINASMSHIWHNLVMEDGIGFTPITSSTSSDNIRTRFNQYQAFLRAGYNISNSKECRLYPLIGIDFSAAVLNIQDKGAEQSVSNFQQAILNNTSSKTLYQPNFGIELGAGFDYLIPLKTKRTDCFTVERSIPIGIRAGYYLNAYAGDWRIDSYKLMNGPTEKQNSVFVTFNIGLGYVLKK